MIHAVPYKKMAKMAPAHYFLMQFSPTRVSHAATEQGKGQGCLPQATIESRRKWLHKKVNKHTPKHKKVNKHTLKLQLRAQESGCTKKVNIHTKMDV